MNRLLIALSMFCGVGCASAQIKEHRVHLWMRWFIASPERDAEPDYKKLNDGRWAIPAPLPSVAGKVGWPTGCFMTDDRTFSSSDAVDVSARVTVEVDFVIQGRNLTLQSHDGREKVRIGKTRNVDCATGQDIQTPKRAAVDSVNIGSIRTSTDGWTKVANVNASVGDPFYTVLGVTVAPKIDFDIVFSFNPLTRDFQIKGTSGIFPSVEAYYSLDGGEARRIINWAPPQNFGPFRLLDGGLGFNSANFEETFKVPVK